MQPITPILPGPGAFKLTDTGVIDVASGALIPSDERNANWKVYQQWLAVPNTPLPADPDVYAPERAAREQERRDVLADATVQQLASMTAAQVDAYVVANVTDLQSAKQLLRKISQVVAYLARNL